MANIGIDLGTTHSLVAIVLDGTARCLLNENDESLLPSAVRYNLEGVPIAVGQPALELAPQKDGVTFTSFKRFMGRSAAEVAEEAEAFGYPLVDPDGAEGAVRFDVGGRAITPVELSSYVLRLLHNRAEECLLNRPGGVVITVPAYFDDAQRQATRDAARVAGLNVLRLLNEPTAAALAYGLDHGSDGQRVVVYDLGGGTFDVSVLELNDGIYQVLATAGDTRLGGDDFDHALAGLLVNQLGYKPDGIEFRQIVRAAEQAKRDLTTVSSAMLSVELRGQPIAADIDRETFETLIGPIIEKTRNACERALSDAGLTVDKIDEVVLVGGSTRVPLVRQMVEKMFGRPPHCDLNPDQVVAMGAAMQADILTGDSELAPEMLLLDVVPLSLGLEVMGGVTERLIPRASTIPASAVQTFTTHVDGQTAVELHIVQGEREMVRDNRSLAKFKLSGLPELPAGVPRVEVQFMVDADGILRVNATEQYTGTSTSLEVQPTYGLSDEEIEDMLEEAIDHAETDIEERLLVDVKVESEQILHHLGKALIRDGDLLEGTEKDDIGNAVVALEAAMKGNDRHRILALSRTVDEISAPFAQRRIERDLARTIGGMSTDAVVDVLGFEENKVEGPSSLA